MKLLLILEKIQKHLPQNVKLISQGQLVAKSLKTYLNRHPEMEQKCGKANQIQFYTTEQPENFNQAASFFYGNEINAKHLAL